MPNKGVIYGIGAEQDSLWGLASGQVRVQVALNEMAPVLGHIHQQGAWFGESEPLLGVPGLVEMQAAGEVALVRVPFVKFRHLANAHPVLWEALAKLTSMNQVLAMSAANDLALRSGRLRLLATLLRLCGQRADYQDSRPLATIPASQQEIARLANVSLSKASELLCSFAREKLIVLEYGRVVVLDPLKLRTLIDP